MRSSDDRVSNARISELFVRMNSIYGHLWSSRFPDARLLQAAKAEWAMALSKRDGEAIRRAVLVCQQQYDMPPTLPQFARLCRPLCDAHRMFKALPRPAPDRAVASAGMARIKQLLG